MKLLIIAIAIVGIVMVINGYYRQNMSCPEPKIVYKYIPPNVQRGAGQPPQTL